MPLSYRGTSGSAVDELTSREDPMAIKVQVIFHSLYTHVYQLAEAVAAGARETPGTEVLLAQVAETLPHEILEKMGAVETKKVFAHVPVADPNALAHADAVILGSPPRNGP